MLPAFVFETPPPVPPAGEPTQFSFGNLLIAAVVFAVLYPLVTRLRTRVSEHRRARWAQEEARTEDGPSRADDEPDRPGDPPA